MKRIKLAVAAVARITRGRIAGAAAALALTGGLALTGAQAHADPGQMTKAEWSAVNVGETKARVEADCACTGIKNGNQDTKNGNTYWEWWYQSPVGEAFIYYRWGTDGAWHAGDWKFWCPGDTLGHEDGSCLQVNF